MPSQPFHVSTAETGDGAQDAVGWNISPHVGYATAVGEEINGIAQPQRLDIGTALFVGDEHLVEVVEVEQHERGVLTAAVRAPFHVPAAYRVKDEPLAVGRKRSILGTRDGQQARRAPLGRNRPQAVERGRSAFPGTGIEHLFAVGRPPAGVGSRRVPGQALGLTALHGKHIYAGRTRAVGTERYPAAVRGKAGVAFYGGRTGQAARVAAAFVGHPEVGPVDERDVIGAQSRLAEQTGILAG